jgi:ATP-dependent exoDNAse (exonuclease V) beta subunit
MSELTLFDSIEPEPSPDRLPELLATDPPPPDVDVRLPDADARRAIAEDLADTLFVEAGAGSGKTKSLVDRVCALVTVKGVPMGEIAAVTFTEKAAAELRDRIRRELGQRALTAEAPARSRAAAALDDLDGAAVSTLHAFAQRILSEHPIEAHLPPRVEVLDDIRSQLAFEERWVRFVDRLLDDPALERPLLLLVNANLGLTHLRTLAIACNANWDLVAERMHEEPDPPPVADAIAPVLEALVELRACDAQCLDPDDKLLGFVADHGEWHDRVLDAPDELEQLRLLAGGTPKINLRFGKAGSWPAHCTADHVRSRLKQLRDELVPEAVRVVGLSAARRLVWEIAQFTLTEAEARRTDGRLEFHDLLVLSRAMLRDPEHGVDVRRRLRERYTHLLLDEFQDTDPIQCDVAALLASGDPDAATSPWDAIAPDAGRLFVVGDPKQSIYRFRRADIGAFLRARDAFGARAVQLTRNFRSSTPVIEFVNDVFGQLIQAESGSQPEYVSLSAGREAPPVGPAVVLLGPEPHDLPNGAGAADRLRLLEAADVAAVITTALREGWSVARRTADGAVSWEACALGDICVLLPARTSLPQLEDALEDAGIPYRAETSSLVYGTREIRDLLVVLQAVDDPTDELALVSALRSAVFGCGDDDLADFTLVHHGYWNHQAPLPASLPAGHPVGDAMRALADWHESRTWLTASELLDRIVRERRVLELGFAHGRPRDLWRRVRFVVEQARAFADADGGGLRDFLHWAELQGSEGSRVVETVLPETDDDAVRILTIHGAKGLEFPITIVSGMTTKALPPRNGVQLIFPHDTTDYALRLSSKLATEEFVRYQPIDEQMDFHEKLRLLYVSATRAQDHLVLSVHRPVGEVDPDHPEKWTHAQLLWDAAQEADGWAPFARGAVAAATASERVPITPPPAWAEWRRELDAALAAASRPRVRAATAIAKEAAEVAAAARAAHAASDPGLDKDARDLELPPWNKGRYGTAVGRAVHAVLQTVDLATGEGIDATSAAQAAAEGVIGHEDVIAARARAALGTEVVRLALANRFRREMYVAAPVEVGAAEPVLVEGYVDLVVDTPDGLVVVDYKTDAWRDERDLDDKLARYRLQGATYALALAAATGRPVTRCVFVFLGDEGAVERDVSDLPQATRDVAALLGASSGGATTP